MKIISILLTGFFIAAGCMTTHGQARAVPIADLGVRGLMGGIQNKRWLSAEEMGAKLSPTTEFVLIGMQGVEEGGVTLGEKEPRSEDICTDLVGIKFELEQDRGIAVGSGSGWNLVPRAPRPISPDAAAYKKIVGDFLRSKGIAKPVVNIVHVYAVDLDGDGKDEVLIEASRYRNGLGPHAEAGDYSVVLMRKIVGRSVRTYELQGEYVRKKIVGGAPNQFALSAVADLDGDGTMEIVVFGEYYEGEFSTTFRLGAAGKPIEIKELSIGCGV